MKKVDATRPIINLVPRMKASKSNGCCNGGEHLLHDPALSNVCLKAPVSLATIQEILNKSASTRTHGEFNEVIPFRTYLERVIENPDLIRTSDQRIYDMIMSKGRKPITIDGETVYKYEFFTNPSNSEDAISGIEVPLHRLMETVGGAARGTGPNKRIILLAGPVGNAKTTIVRTISSGLEAYSRTPEGTLYSIQWDLRDEAGNVLPMFKHLEAVKDCEIFDDPFKLIPEEPRKEIIEALNQNRSADAGEKNKILNYLLRHNGDVCPSCRDIFNKLIAYHSGDIEKALSHVKAKRLVLDEETRTGLTFYGAKDEKSHNAEELVGGANLRMLMKIGKDSDPQAINYDGDVSRANRGLVHFGEILKLPKEITYPLLDGAQDRHLKASKGALVPFDEMMFGTTNVPDWERVFRDRYQEAIRSRIVPITVPYLSKVDDEMGIYKKTFSRAAKDLGMHEAPHGLWASCLWAITTRLGKPTGQLTMIQKALLYSGVKLKGYTEQQVQKMKDDVPDEEMELLKGISPRDIQDALSNALQHPDVIDEEKGTRCIDPYIILENLEDKLSQPIANVTPEEKRQFAALLKEVEKELDLKLLKDVKRAVSGDEKEIENLFNAYKRNVSAWDQKEKVDDPITRRKVDPDENLMRSVEDKLDINDSQRRDFRRNFILQIGQAAMRSEEYTYKTDETLRRALEDVLLDRHRDVTISLPAITKETASEKEQQQLEVIRTRLIKSFGYCPHCANIALSRAANPQNRGPAKG